jgi:hypothetical protein
MTSWTSSAVSDPRGFEAAYTLGALARESGGRLFTPRGSRELPAIYEAIAEELSHQYLIGYLPAHATDGTFRRVSVGVLQPAAGVARTRAGYYADAGSSDGRAFSGADPRIRR